MANFVLTTQTWVVRDEYTDANNKTTFQEGHLTITVDANGNGTWNIHMYNNEGGDQSTAVSLRLFINHDSILDNYYSYTNYKGEFPSKNDTSNSGNFTIPNNLEKFVVDFGVCCMQSATESSNKDRLTNGAMTRLGSATSDPVWGEYFTRTKATYTVTFDVNGGDEVDPTSQTVTSDSTYGTLPVPTRDGYEFIGWYTEASGGTKIESSTIVSINGDITLYAQWECLGVKVYVYYNGERKLGTLYGRNSAEELKLVKELYQNQNNEFIKLNIKS